MGRPDRDRIGGGPCNHVEDDETRVGGRTRGKGRRGRDRVPVACAVEVRQCRPGTRPDKRKGGRHAGRVGQSAVPDRSAKSLCGFVEAVIASGVQVTTGDRSAYASLTRRGYKHFAVAERGDPRGAGEYLPIIHPLSQT